MVTDPLPCCSRRDQTRQIGQAVLADSRRSHVSPASVHLFICTLTLPSLLFSLLLRLSLCCLPKMSRRNDH